MSSTLRQAVGAGGAAKAFVLIKRKPARTAGGAMACGDRRR
jgi:hypothetical protein